MVLGVELLLLFFLQLVLPLLQLRGCQRLVLLEVELLLLVDFNLQLNLLFPCVR